jgi:hypothetical protein
MRFPVSFWKRAAGGGPAPTVASVSPTLGDTLGGELLTIIGTNFTGATAVSIGGTAAVGFSVLSTTEIIAIAPAHAAGAAQSILVTAPGGTSAANTLYEFWSPAVLALTGFWERGDYDAQTATWTARASAGTSGGRNLTQATATLAPTETNLEPIFDGVNDTLAPGLPTSSFFAASAFSMLFVVTFQGASPVVSPDGDPWLIADTSDYMSVSYTAEGVRVFIFPAQRTAPSPLSVGTKGCIQVNYDGTTLKCRVNGSAWQTVAAANVSSLGGQAVIGRNTGSTAFLNAAMSVVALSNISQPDAIHDKALAWARAHHGVSI